MSSIQTYAIATSVACLAIAGSAAADEFSGVHSAVRNAGDLNSDGVADILLRRIGKVQTVAALSGRDGSVLWVAARPASVSYFGCSMDAAGDVDSDGTPDVIVGTGSLLSALGWPLADPLSLESIQGSADPSAPRHCLECAQVLSGKDGSVLFTLDGGPSVAGASDMNGDGRPDVIVGGPGVVRVYSGRDGTLVHEIETPSDFVSGFGHSVIGLADIDGDGRADFAASAPGAMEGSTPPLLSRSPGLSTAAVILFSGRTGCELARNEHVWTLGDGMAWTLARVGDMDLDGVEDLAVGMLHRGVVTLSGRDLHPIAHVDHRVPYLDAFASSLDGLGDVDGDRVPDLVVGANETIDTDGGFVDVISGKSGRLIQTPVLTDRAGVDACSIGDVDGDGIAEVAYVLEPRFSIPVDPSTNEIPAITDELLDTLRAKAKQTGPHGLHVISTATWMELYQVDIDEIPRAQWSDSRTNAREQNR